MKPALEELGNRTQNIATSERLVDFVLSAEYDDLSSEAIDFIKIYLMDSLAVGVAGLCSPGADIVLKSSESWGTSDQARIIGRPGLRKPAPTAAYINGYQIHALEWDGLHEESVVIAMCVAISALMAEAEQNPVSGKDFTTALAVAVEVAVTLGWGSETAPRFFRPAVAGLMGAAMGLAKLRGFDKAKTHETLGLAYSQASGTMQAHWEGEMMLAIQVGVGARAAIYAVDMAEAGAQAPKDVLLGKFGFYTLFETAENIDTYLDKMGKPWAITGVAHKPFPAGRATQSVLTMFQEIFAKRDLDPANIEEIIVRVPPLIMLLVGRPLTDAMTASYARLCLKFIGPMMLLNREIDPRLFPNRTPPPDDIKALGEKFNIQLNDIEDPNALGPQSMTIRMKDGTEINSDCDIAYGSPGNRMQRPAREQKVKKCFEVGGYKRDPQELIEIIESLAELKDVRDLFSTVCE